jgi:hypothetical protein
MKKQLTKGQTKEQHVNYIKRRGEQPKVQKIRGIAI